MQINGLEFPEVCPETCPGVGGRDLGFFEQETPTALVVRRKLGFAFAF